MSTHGTGHASGDGTYRIIDEGPQQVANRKRAPWSPRALFFGTWFLFVFSGNGAPFGLFFSALNWARLGHASKRLPWIGLSVALLALTPGLLVLREHNGVPSLEIVRAIKAVATFGLAFRVLMEQRPVYEEHVASGGPVAKPWALWLVIFAFGVLMFWAEVQKKNDEMRQSTSNQAARRATKKAQ